MLLGYVTMSSVEPNRRSIAVWTLLKVKVGGHVPAGSLSRLARVKKRKQKIGQQLASASVFNHVIVS